MYEPFQILDRGVEEVFCFATVSLESGLLLKAELVLYLDFDS